MDVNQKWVQMVGELLSGVDTGDFSNVETIPEKYTYGYLYALFMLADALDNGRTLYEQFYDIAVAHGKYTIRKKVQNGEKIKVAFLTISAAEWPAEEVYRLLEKDKRIECYVLAAPLADRDVESRRETYKQTYQYFCENGYQVKGGYREESDTSVPWEDLGGMPDIVVHITPWFEALPVVYQITSFPLKCIHCYIPYGIYSENSTDGSYALNFVYNKEFFNMMWKIYVDSKQNLEGYQKYGLLHGKNAAYSGYAKMDYFYTSREWKEEEIRKLWKIPEGRNPDDMKKVIIAPHHAILGYGGIAFSTFPKNAYFLLYLAKKYQDKVSFIYKPHPNLRLRAVEAGMFESYEAYDAYMAQWNMLPNARVVQDTAYLDIFDTSDGMIMDSISFLAEYLYANKPLLFLKRNGQAFNELGKEIIRVYDSEWGEDYAAIEEFLQDVIIKGNDRKKDIRGEVWQNELDYMGVNGCSASEYIYRDIGSLLEIK